MEDPKSYRSSDKAIHNLGLKGQFLYKRYLLVFNFLCWFVRNPVSS